MKTKFVCVSGHAQNGKDTFAKMMADIISTPGAMGKSSKVIHYADLLKYICKELFDWNGEKDEYGRSLLQYVGTDKIRKKDGDFWVRFVADIASMFDGEWDYIVVPDTRFPNEVEYLKSRGFDVLHVRIERPQFDNGLTAAQKKHPSETALDGIEPDVIIVNESTKAALFCNALNLCETNAFFR